MVDVSRKTINTVENGVFIPSTILAQGDRRREGDGARGNLRRMEGRDRDGGADEVRKEDYLPAAIGRKADGPGQVVFSCRCRSLLRTTEEELERAFPV